MSAPFTYEELSGEAVRPYLRELGELRIAVFREFPYLYDGDLDYEEHYLETYVHSTRSLVVLLRHEGRLVGATTCLPMEDESPEFQAPFLASGFDLNEVFYFGESIILPECRGQRAGHEFFRRREEHARRTGPFRYTAFCAVERPADHPLRPAGHRDLYDYWNRRGYVKRPEFTTTFRWRDIDGPDETAKTMTFWVKTLRGG